MQRSQHQADVSLTLLSVPTFLGTFSIVVVLSIVYFWLPSHMSNFDQP